MYATPTWPVVAATHESAGAAAPIVMPQLLLLVVPAAVPLASTTCAVNAGDPATVGVPVIAPVAAFSVSPFGKLPEMI